MNTENLKENITNAILHLDNEEIKLLIEEYDNSASGLAKLLLEVMKDIIHRFLLPYSSLLSRNEDGWTYWDLEKLAGYAYPGLISGVLELQFPDLSNAPSEEKLEKELQEAGFQISSSKKRSEFFSGWMATRANNSLQFILKYLNTIDLPFNKNRLDMVEELILLDINGSIKFRLARLLKKWSPEVAAFTSKKVKESYLQELLSENS